MYESFTSGSPVRGKRNGQQGTATFNICTICLGVLHDLAARGGRFAQLASSC